MFNRKAPDGVLRPLINAAQMMMVVLMFPVDWPDSITMMSRIFDGVNLDFISIASPACLGMPLNFFWRFAIMTTFTLVAIATPWCQTVAGTSYLMADFSLTCTDPEWYGMLVPVVLVIVLFSFGMPALFALLLWRRRNQLEDPNTKKLLGMLYASFKPNMYFFESIFMLFKLALWATLVFFPNGSQFQLATSAAICVLQLTAHAHYEPYNDRTKNTLQYVSLLLVAFTSFSGLVLNYLKTAKELAHERRDLPKKEMLEGTIAGFNLFAELMMWLGVAVLYGDPGSP
eukprot:g6066.t1